MFGLANMFFIYGLNVIPFLSLQHKHHISHILIPLSNFIGRSGARVGGWGLFTTDGAASNDALEYNIFEGLFGSLVKVCVYNLNYFNKG